MQNEVLKFCNCDVFKTNGNQLVVSFNNNLIENAFMVALIGLT